MSGTLEKLQHELQAAQRALAEAKARCDRHDAEHQAASKELEDNRSALLFMLEDLEASRRKVEHAHQEWMAALDTVEDPIFLHDQQFRILRANRAYQRRAGIPFKQIIGQPYYEIFPKTGAPLAGCLRAMEKAEAEAEEVAVGNATYRSRSFSVHDEHGVHLYSMHIFEDITEKRQADVQLRLFRTLLDNSSDAIFIVDPATSRFLDVNEAACRDLRYTRDELLQRGVVDIQTILCNAAAWQAHVQELRAQYHALLEFEALRKDGSRFPVEASLRHVTAVNRAYIIAMVRDITERKKAEQQLQLTQFAMDNAYVEIYWLDKDARIHYVNKQACATLGYTQEELLRLSIPDVDPLFPEAQWKAHWQSLQHDKTQFFETMHKRKDGVAFPVEVVANYVKFGDLEYNVAFTKDITERKRAEDALRKSKDLLRSVVENAPARIFWKDRDSRYLGCNTQFAKDAGHSSPDELTGKTDFEMGWKDQAELYRADDKAVMESGNPKLDYEEPSTTPDGNTIWLRTSKVPLRDESNQVIGILGIYEDITERKRAEAAFRALVGTAVANVGVEFFRETVRSLCRWIGVECVIVGELEDGNRVRALAMQLDGQAVEHYEYALSGTPCDNVAHKGYCEYPEGVCQLFPSDKDLSDMGAEAYVGTPIRDKNGKAIGVLCAISRHKIVPQPMLKGVFEIIAARAGTEIERKRADEALKESEEKYRSIYENTQVGLYRTSANNGKLMMANDAMAKMFGFDSIEEATAKYITSEHYVDPEARERLLDVLRKHGKFDNFEARLTRNDGIVRWFQYSGRFVQNKGYIEGVATDITEHKQVEAAIQHANRALATLSTVNRELVHATDEEELLQAICQAIVEQRGYRLAWVGYVQHDESKSIKIMARAGHDEGYLDGMQLTWAETEHGMGPSGRAIRSGAAQVCQDIASDPLYRLWRDAALQRGYAADIALPLARRSGEVFGILHVYAAEVNAFTTAEIGLLEEMAGDLAFGVRSLHIRRQRDLAQKKIQQQLTQLQDSLEDTVRAMASIVEMRDPYTAGHQARVADLAAAIARQMGLPDEQAHGIHLAGTVHDLGKVKIPAEILSKPGRITDLEFGLIKVHPQAGYDILKGISFPWPIAQMVLQHHERMDGSGYPQGLKGEAILLEARILSVADVVEAMSSHRPYRPGLGIEVALAEITKQRSMHYDSQVVDACLALFREQHYAFKS